MRVSAKGRGQGATFGTCGAWLSAASMLLVTAGCFTKKGAEVHYYEQHIQPIFNSFCVGNTSPCHKIDEANGTNTALGNLDLTSFDAVQKRRDVLRTYGSYPHPLLLLKAVPERDVSIPYGNDRVLSEIKHAGGKPIAVNSDAFFELKAWLDNGAYRDGLPPAPAPRQGYGPCSPALPPSGQVIPVDTGSPAYQTFAAQVQPVLRMSCTFASCHSSPQADLYLTCGDDAEQLQFNFAQAAGFVAPPGTAVVQSEILLRPLSPQGGGVSHTGGIFFESREMDQTWQMLRDWATLVQENPLQVLVKTAGETFFEENVMPKLVQRGCALEGCHSPDGFNDFRLRSGAAGFFAPLAMRRNYEATLHEFMALDTVDVRQSRIVKKNIILGSGGIVHRAGPLLEDGEPVETTCPQPFDPLTNTRAFCVFAEWHRIERQAAGAAVSAMPGTLPLAFVSRPASGDNLMQFDTHAPGADLKLADATADAMGRITVGNVRSGLAGCSGLSGAGLDVRGPEWSYDGTKLVFAARTSATGGLDLWMLDMAGGGCRQLTTDNGRLVNGVRVHNFDPVFAPDGSIVYASTRAGTLTLKYYLPNSDLYRVGPDLNFSNPEQMTFLLNSELAPAFMQDGRVSFTAEKATETFYQLSGRRINWDLSDYHPLIAQRAMSIDRNTGDPHPSVDYQQATEIREGLDRNFIFIASDEGALGGGGALATFNRSVGPFEAGRDDRGTFVKSMVIVDPAATGKAGTTTGLYRSPFSLPNGEILASYAAIANDAPKYDLVAVNEQNGSRRPLASDPSLSYVEAALGYKRAERMLFRNVPQLVFGGRSGQGGEGVMHIPDGPVLATLLGSNLRRGRNVADMDRAARLKVYQENPPPGPGTSGVVYTSRTPLGSASFEADRSIKVNIPSGRPLILELIDGNGAAVFTMTEEHQMTAGEYITPGPPRALFNSICGGCHGSLSGSELDVAVNPDALTGASLSLSRDRAAKSLQ